MQSRLILAVLLGCGAALAAASDSVDVIVRFKDQAAIQGHQHLLERGALHKRSLGLVNGHAYRIRNRDLSLFANDPNIEYIGPDHPLSATGNVPTLTQPDYGWMTVLGVTSPTATLKWDGSGIGVAVIDSGVINSDELKGTDGKAHLVYQQSFIPGVGDTNDHYGHGTMVAGLVGGNGKQSTGNGMAYTVRGIAPNVNIINLRVLDDNGGSTDSTVIAAIQAAISLKNKYNIRVINLSLGRPVYSSYTADPLCIAVQQAWNAGIVVVVAAGNNGRDNSYGNQGYATITAPGNSPYVITVGAMNTGGTLSTSDDKIASYSSKGPTLLDHVAKPDLVAPGNRVVSLLAGGSTLLKEYPGNAVAKVLYQTGSPNDFSNVYFEMSGTSLAAPMVSGAAALLIQQNSALTPDQVKAKLMKTATKLPLLTTVAVDPVTGQSFTSQNDVFTVGAGYLNVQSALADQELPVGSAASPNAVFNQINSTVSLSTSPNAIWGNSAAWGTGTVWGASAAWGSSVAWGSSAAWGSGTLWGSSAAWGSSVAWGSSAAWGSSVIWGKTAVWGTTSAVQTESARVAINGEN